MTPRSAGPGQRQGQRRLFSPTLLAFLVAGAITAALAYMVLASTAAETNRPEPAGTALPAPTEQALAMETPTRVPDAPTAVTGLVLDRAPEQSAPPTASPTEPPVPTVAAPTPTPRVLAPLAAAPLTNTPESNPLPTVAPPVSSGETTLAAPTMAPDTEPIAPTNTPVPAAPAPAVAVIPVAPVDQSPPTAVPAPVEVAAAPPVEPTTAPVTGNAVPILFPTVVANIPSGNAPGGEQTATGSQGTGQATNPIGSLTGNQDQPGNAADNLVDGEEIAERAGRAANDQPAAADVTAATRRQTRNAADDMRECIEAKARGGRNRDRQNTADQGQNQAPGTTSTRPGRDDARSCGTTGQPGAPDMGDAIENEVDSRIDDAFEKAGIKRD